jgi:PKD repeat protein
MCKHAVIFITVLSLLFGGAAPAATAAVSTSAMRVFLYVDQTQAFVNGASTPLDSPATVVNGKMYVPVKFLGDAFGFPVQYDGAANSIAITAGTTDVFIDLKAKTTLVGGIPGTFEPTFRIINERLMAQLTWMMDRIGATYKYDKALNRVEVSYLPAPAGVQTEGSSKPVAKFTFGKSSYMMGEKIKYIDLSYDVEGDGIAFVSWKNAKEAFFEPGKHEVSLQVKDSNNNVSDWFTKTIMIENETKFSKVEFQMHHANIQTFVKLTRPEINQSISNAAKVPFTIKEDMTRRLVVSNSPETVKEIGVLYKDRVNGSARLYANHINSMEHPMKLAVIATNEGTLPVTIRTTRQGEVYPSIYANLIGYQASVDFLVGDVTKKDVLVKPGESAAYAVLPNFMPGQGVNLMYDVETDGEVTFSFASMMPNDPIEAVVAYPELAYDRHVRGSFPVSNVQWEVDAKAVTGAKKISIGDNVSDVFVRGYDSFRKEFVSNFGNYGVTYHIRIMNPEKAAIVLLARGGIYKGPVKINGEMILAPVSGVITAYDGVFMLHRTNGTEPYVDIELTPPAGSYLPIDLVMYPLSK